MLHITEFDTCGEILAAFNDADRSVRERMAEIEFVPVAASSPRAVWGRTLNGFALVTDDEANIPEAQQAGPITDVPAPVRQHEIEYRAYRAYIARERARKNIIIVNDGTFRWGADREELEAAMRVLGWEQEGRCWVEPEGSEDEPGGQYTRLCDLVSPLPGMDGANNDWQEPEEGAWDDLPTLVWAPNVSRRHWLMIE